jgi:DNA-binding CsgD family transcriptional regulator
VNTPIFTYVYPYVGRSSELAWLRTTVSRTVTGRSGRIILVSGEAGIGKSRLVAEATAKVRVAATIAFPRAVLPAPGAGLATLARQGGEHAAQLQAELVGTAVDDAGWRTSRICNAADVLIGELAPAAVVVEDVQWADELTLRWLERVGDHLLHTPVAVIMTIRSVGPVPERVTTAVTAATRLGVVDAITLGPLTVADVAALASAAGRHLSHDEVTRLHDRSDGLALAVEALLDDVSTQPGSRSPNGNAAVGVLSAVVGQQLAELSAEARTVVVVSALCPQPAPVSAVRAVTGLAPAAFSAACDQAIAAGVLSSAGRGSIEFRHELHRESVQHGLPAAERRGLHHAIAVALAHRGGAPAAHIATQYIDAGDDIAGADWLETAAREAVDAHDHGNALTMLGAAIELVGHSGVDDRVVALSRQAIIAARAGDQPLRGLATLDEAERLVVSDAARGRVLLGRARLVSYVADYSARFHALQRARRAFDAAADQVGLAMALGELAYPAGDAITIDDRVALGRDGLALAEQAGDPIAVALCAANLGAATAFSGEYAVELWERATSRSLLSVSDGREMLARNLCNRAIAAAQHARYDEALAAVREAAHWRSEPFYRSVFDAIEALCAWRLGDWKRARSLAVRSREEYDFPYARVADVVRTGIDFESQRHPDAAALPRTVELLIESWDEFALDGQALLMRMRALRREPSPDRGLAAVVSWVVHSQVKTGWEDVLVAAADLGPAVLRRCHAALTGSRPAGRRGEAALAYAAGATLVGSAPGGAADHFLAAADAFESLGEPWLLARSLEAASAALAADGRRATDPRRRAADIYVELGADRSLAGLIRTQGRSPALEGYAIPPTQVRGTTPGLTPRERDVAELARLGLTIGTIAQRLDISARTAEHHLESVRRKLGIRRTRDLVALLAESPSP